MQWVENLLQQTEEVDQEIQTKDDRISKVRDEVETLNLTVNKKLEGMGDIHQVSQILPAFNHGNKNPPVAKTSCDSFFLVAFCFCFFILDINILEFKDVFVVKSCLAQTGPSCGHR